MLLASVGTSLSNVKMEHFQNILTLNNAAVCGHLYGLLVNGSGVCDAVDFRGSLDVDVEHLMPLLRLHGLCGSLVHSHRMTRKTVLLFKLGVQQINGCQPRL